ncbi:MAG: sigma-70 family RNA polymerase sigma factor, partial [Actinomycetota bacterium]
MTPGARNGLSDDVDERELFARLPDDAEAREELVHRFLPLAEYLARRFSGRGESPDDLFQVASLGLLNAIDRFDLGRDVQFSTYAAVTIVGELKRHFRDKGWAVRVPRRLQEVGLRINAVLPELSQELGRSPTVQEIAQRCG